VQNRSLRALLVDVGPTRRSQIADALTQAGWSLHAEPVAGTRERSEALARRCWDVLIYAGEGERPTPARKAIALARTADPQLAFVAAVPSVRRGDVAASCTASGPPRSSPRIPRSCPPCSTGCWRLRARTRATPTGCCSSSRRTYALRRPCWVADVAADDNLPRRSHAVRAGLQSAVAFPIGLADGCAGVLEFFSEAIEEPDAQVAAMFATVGGQLAHYLERHRL
jgi:hypothetical protein